MSITAIALAAQVMTHSMQDVGRTPPPFYKSSMAAKLCREYLDNGWMGYWTCGECVGDFHRGIVERYKDPQFQKDMALERREVKNKGVCIALLREVMNTPPDKRIS